MTYSAKAYAKVNLHLEVLNKRSDFYHNIFSFNASLDIFDRLKFKRLNVFNNKSGDISIDIQPGGGEYPDTIISIRNEDNLITKAIKAYLNKIKKSASISIVVVKNIPAGAGLGGGSSDAAAALRYLNNYLSGKNEGLPENELRKIGASVGADIPFCLSGKFAICEGIGEIIENLHGKLNYWILVVNPGIIINTAEAYLSLERTFSSTISEKEINEKKLLFHKGILEGEISRFKHILKNDFEKPIFNVHPVLKDIKDEITGFSPEYVTMTGSGSSIIGIFKDKKKANTAKMALEKKAKVLIARFL